MTNMFRKMLLAAFCSLSLATVACGPGARLSVPDGFAHVGGDYDDRVASADGVVIAARVVANEPKANLDFWTTAIDLRLQQRGYQVDGKREDIKNAAGLPGRSLRYVYFDGQRKNRYVVDVYATDRRLLLVEATGDATDFDANRQKVEAAMRSARIGS
jgi:hypothetical protein